MSFIRFFIGYSVLIFECLPAPSPVEAKGQKDASSAAWGRFGLQAGMKHMCPAFEGGRRFFDSPPVVGYGQLDLFF
jgi:hypothetical protein